MASYVGFANLPNQVHRKSVKKGFEFTLMVVGKFSILSLSTVDLQIFEFDTCMHTLNNNIVFSFLHLQVWWILSLSCT